MNRLKISKSQKSIFKVNLLFVNIYDIFKIFKILINVIYTHRRWTFVLEEAIGIRRQNGV